jgi:hypothetical protein
MIDLAVKRDMVIYTKNEQYMIWADTKAYCFHIQVVSQPTLEKGYTIAADAIEEAHRLCM